VSEPLIDFNAYFEAALPTLILKPDIPEFTIVKVNQAYLDATSSRAEEVIGEALFNAFPQNPFDLETQNAVALKDSIIQAITTKKPQVLRGQKYNIPVRSTDRFSVHYWEVTNSPVLNSAGEVEYVAHVVVDITQAVEATQKEQSAFEIANAQTKTIEEIEDRLRLAIDSAGLGTWNINVNTRELTVSDRFKELLGYLPEDVIDIATALERVRKDYRETVANELEKAIAGHITFDMEYPVIGYHNGKLKWIKATGKLYPEVAGKPAHFSGTQMDITAHKLDEISKNDFIARVSHELKTPLTSAKAYIQMMLGKSKKIQGDFNTGALEKVHEQIEKMHTMIKGFLDVAKWQETQIQLTKQTFVLSDVVKEAVEDVWWLNPTHEIKINCLDDVKVFADRDKIIQVVNNFLSNATKYSHRGTTIEVNCRQEDGKAVVSVMDEGFGISAKDQERLFDRFFRVESVQTQHISGFGIGLYLCAEIIQQHNGSIWVESEPGKGSVFYFSLPAE